MNKNPHSFIGLYEASIQPWGSLWLKWKLIYFFLSLASRPTSEFDCFGLLASTKKKTQ